MRWCGLVVAGMLAASGAPAATRWVSPPLFVVPHSVAPMDLTGVWAGTVEVEAEGAKGFLGASLRLSHDGRDVLAALSIEAGDGSSRISKGVGEIKTGGELVIRETKVFEATGVFGEIAADLRSYVFRMMGPAGKSPDTLETRGGDFYGYRSYHAVLVRQRER